MTGFVAHPYSNNTNSYFTWEVLDKAVKTVNFTESEPLDICLLYAIMWDEMKMKNTLHTELPWLSWKKVPLQLIEP